MTDEKMHYRLIRAEIDAAVAAEGDVPDAIEAWKSVAVAHIAHARRRAEEREKFWRNRSPDIEACEDCGGATGGIEAASDADRLCQQCVEKRRTDGEHCIECRGALCEEETRYGTANGDICEACSEQAKERRAAPKRTVAENEWHDYIRVEVERCNDYWRGQMACHELMPPSIAQQARERVIALADMIIAGGPPMAQPAQEVKP